MVMAGGAVGSGLRYMVGLLCYRWHFTTMPLGTILVNLIGCLILGMILGMAERYSSFSQSVFLMVSVGLCGAFTTFSAFTADTFRLISNGQELMAIGYLCLNVIGGFLLFYIGRIIFVH